MKTSLFICTRKNAVIFLPTTYIRFYKLFEMVLWNFKCSMGRSTHLCDTTRHDTTPTCLRINKCTAIFYHFIIQRRKRSFQRLVEACNHGMIPAKKSKNQFPHLAYYPIKICSVNLLSIARSKEFLMHSRKTSTIFVNRCLSFLLMLKLLCRKHRPMIYIFIPVIVVGSCMCSLFQR